MTIDDIINGKEKLPEIKFPICKICGKNLMEDFDPLQDPSKCNNCYYGELGDLIESPSGGYSSLNRRETT
jgi:hypothetical protein